MALTPGLVPNIRLDQDQQDLPLGEGQDTIVVMDADPDADQPEMDVDGNVLRIDHGDGSISVSLDGRPIESGKKKKTEGWYENLAEEMDENTLSEIAQQLIKGIEEDIDSRKEWIEDRAQGLRLLGLKIEIPGQQGTADGAPVEGMSRIRHPLLLESVLRFQANARSELLPTDGPVKVRVDSNQGSPDLDLQAEYLEKDFNHYLTATAKEYYPDTDKMLFMLGFGGSAFKKVYYCPLRNRPVSETVDADDLIVNNEATDLSNARRITHRISMRPSVVKRMQIIGAYRDIDLGQAKQKELDAVQREKNAIQGTQDDIHVAEDRDREIYECYCELDIPGYEHEIDGEPSGLEVPYRVTIDVSSKQVLNIVRNYDEEDQELPEARTHFVKYDFVPGLKFYGMGLLQILGNTTNALTAVWRELLDAGMYANFPGFLYAKTSGRQNSNIFRVPPGGGAQIDTAGMAIQQAVMPLPYKEPSGALANFAQTISEYGQRVGGTSELQVGEGKSDAPVGTTLAIIEQAQKVLNSVHKRLHAAQADEFQLLAQCFREHPNSFWQRNKRPAKQWDEQTFLTALDNYELVPQADPNTASHIQRVMKVTALIQLAQQAPNLYNLDAVNREALLTLGWSNATSLLRDTTNNPPQPDPQTQAAQMAGQAAMITAQSKMMEAQTKVAETQKKLGGGQGLSPEDQVKMAEIQQKNIDAQLDATNRKRDRESRERIAAVKLAEDLAANPAGLGIVKQILDPGMIQRLEGNEQPMTPTPGGVIQ
jgi:hypothetical protein